MFLRRVIEAVTLLVVIAITCIFFLIRAKNEGRYGGDFPDFNNPDDIYMSRKNLTLKVDYPFEVGCREPDVSSPRANAAFVMLARNSELSDVVSSMRSMERHFNQWFKYPWVLLNDESFSKEFKDEVKKHTKAQVEFGVVESDHWEFPKDIDKDMFDELIQGQGDREIMYGNLQSYHKMCRFYSGHFYDHPLVRKRKWYWRVEPDVQFFCDLTYDPFIEMEKHNKKYGFNVILEELYYTVPSLFMETKAFIKANNINVKSAWDIMVKKYHTVKDLSNFQYFTWANHDDLRSQVKKNVRVERILKQKHKTNEDLEKLNNFETVRDIFLDAKKMPPLWLDKVDGEEYNLCHFWSNFEIARTDLFLSETYQKYFQHLESVGGFYKERWGDAPVHSLAVAMMLSKEELHYFRDIGYKHSTFGHCPNNAPEKQLPYVSNGFDDYAPEPWYRTFLPLKPDAPVRNGVGCRCECPRNFKSLEDTSSKCVRRFAEVMSDGYETFKPIDIKSMETQIDVDLP